MKTATIEELAYVINEAKENGSSPIFFLGAGASRSGGIPLAAEIVADILENHSNNPRIKNIKDEDKTYPSLMECLGPHGRNKLLKGYIDSCKINVTHIYLAQLMKQGYADYVLTVNFDNLMLRALALFDEFPSTYDMAILKDLTTTTFKEKSVIYLHGQHHGLWLLNTQEEMAKVKEIVPPILHSIKNERPWVFIGYSGEDPIFQHIKDLGRFDNGLYWVSYNNNDPCSSVCSDLLDKSNTNAFVIKDYDSDSFMLRLNSELGLGQPQIIDKPFSSLSSMLNNIVDIDDEEHFKGVKERLEVVKEQVAESILKFEEGKVESSVEINAKTEIDLLKKEIIDLIIAEDYQEEKIAGIVSRSESLKDEEITELIVGLYYNWGHGLVALAATKQGGEAETLYQEAFEKYQQAIEIKPDDHQALYNWGHGLGALAAIKQGGEAETLYQEAFEKYRQAVEIKPGKHQAFNNWGHGLGALAATKSGDEAEALYQEAFEKYRQAIEIKPDKHQAFNNWGHGLCALAATKSGDEAEALYQEAFEKYRQAIEIKPDDHQVLYNWGHGLGALAATKQGGEAETLYQEAFEKYRKTVEIKPGKHQAFNNWGHGLGALAATKSGDEAEALYQEAFEKYRQAIEIKPDDHQVLYNWGTTLLNWAKTKSGVEAKALFEQSLEKLNQAVALGGQSYNLACVYSLRSEKEQALLYLSQSLENKEIEPAFVIEDEDWAGFVEDEDFKKIISKYQ